MKKKPEATLAASRQPSLFARIKDWLRGRSIRSRIFVYFLLFTALLLVLLWLFQIVLLDDFYRHLKTNMLTSSAETLIANIDNEDLQTLSDRLSQQNDICILGVDEQIEAVISSESTPQCIIHHISNREIRRFIQALKDSGESSCFVEFPMMGFRDSKYDAKSFAGRVPPQDDGRTKSMLYVKAAQRADGATVYLLLNAQITPVNATVQTLRDQLLYITLILVVLSFLLSYLLSRRITRPIVDTNEAAKALSHAEFTPPKGKMSYREIRELNQTLSQAAADLGRVEALQRELIANISHDLRTPLTLIEGYAEVMRDLPGENTPENMQVIIDETSRLSTLVNAVLDYSVAKSGQSPVNAKEYDLTQSIQGILSRYQKLTEQDGYQVRFEHDGHAIVCADELKVSQVIYNLINNALTYTGEDKLVTVRQTIEGSKVRISILDTGEGIAPDELEHIWSRYYRGQKPHKRAAIGTGLGLSIVQGILDSHGLPYGVTSGLGKGAEFFFEAPLVRAE
mgnify:CR=1 FL=1